MARRQMRVQSAPTHMTARTRTDFDAPYFGSQFRAMFDVVFAILQRMGNASNDIQFHLMPFISHEYTFVHHPLEGEENWYECTVANRLRQRNSSIPGYEQSMQRAHYTYACWVMSGVMNRERESLRRIDEERLYTRMLEASANDENEMEYEYGEGDDTENEGEGDTDGDEEGDE
jgi:hypothetical protein